MVRPHITHGEHREPHKAVRVRDVQEQEGRRSANGRTGSRDIEGTEDVHTRQRLLARESESTTTSPDNKNQHRKNDDEEETAKLGGPQSEGNTKKQKIVRNTDNGSSRISKEESEKEAVAMEKNNSVIWSER